MRRWLTLASLTVACGAPAAKTPSPGSHVRMTAKDIVKESSPAIVRIESGEGRREGVGTGFVVDKSGVIATNLHVIAGESKITVKMSDNSTPPVVAIVGIDPGHDLALLRVSAGKPLPVIRLGDSSAMVAGDQVIAIGNPLGLNTTVSAGLISSVRAIRNDLTILQTSAPISPGSSGGPLLNQFGEVIGVTTFISVQGQNLNFAVPTDYLRPMIAKPIALQLDEFAKATREAEAEPTRPHNDSDDDSTVPPRHVPEHAIKVLDGCKPADIDDTVRAIQSAITIGAPAYNKMTPQGYEECFRIYEGTALRLEHDGGCKGVRDAFGDGLLHAGSAKSFKDKAWALRDAFDGLIAVSAKWCLAKPKQCPQSIQQMLGP